MNKNIYKLVWSDETKTFVAVNEFAAAKGKRSRLSKAVASAAILLASTVALAAPLPVLNGTPNGGTPVVSGTTMTITTGVNRSIYNWNTFDIANGYTVNYVQPGTSSISLNRVGGGVSQIFGSLTSNGQVFLINPNGIIFGSGSSVNVQGIVASTMDTDTDAFLNESNKAFTFNSSNSTGYVTVESGAQINSHYAALLAPTVLNEGLISTTIMNAGELDPSVVLAAGGSVTLTLDDAQSSLVGVNVTAGDFATLVQNRGAVVADNGAVYMSAKSLNDFAASVINQGPATLYNQEQLVALSDGVIGIRAKTVSIEASSGTGTANVNLAIDSPIEADTVDVTATSANAADVMLGNLTVDGLLTVNADRDIVFGTVEAENLYATAGRQISQLKVEGVFAEDTYIKVEEKATLITSADQANCTGPCIDVSNPANDFHLLEVQAYNSDVHVADEDGLSIVANAKNLRIDANMQLEDDEAPQAVVLSDNQDGSGYFTISGNLVVNSNGGDIGQVGTIQVGGNALFDAARYVIDPDTEEVSEEERGNILLCNPGNQFTGYVSLLGNDIVLANGQELNLGQVYASPYGDDTSLYGAHVEGARAVDATGRVNISTTQGNLNVWGPVVTTFDGDRHGNVAVVLAAGTSRGVYDRVKLNGIWVPTANEPIYDVIFKSWSPEAGSGYVAGNKNTTEAYIQTGIGGTWQIYSDGPTQQDHSALWWIADPTLVASAAQSLQLTGTPQASDLPAFYAVTGGVVHGFHASRNEHHRRHHHDDEEDEDHHEHEDHYFDQCCTGWGGLTSNGNGIFYRINPVVRDVEPYRPYPVAYEPNKDNLIEAPVDVESTLIDDGENEGGIEKSGGFTDVDLLGVINVVSGTGFKKEIPAETFKHSDPDAQVTYSATLTDGKPLPEWVKFDPSTLTLEGKPPKGESGTLSVKVIAQDQHSDTASTTIAINY